jgi:hypothetical protein
MEDVKESKRSTFLKATLVLLALAALAAGAFALAPDVVQAQDKQPAEPGELVTGFRDHGRMGWHRFDGDLDYDVFLAEALDISVDQLQSAREQARAAMLDEAVARGTITEAQVALMEARAALREYIDEQALLAEALGITAAELEAAREVEKPLSVLIYELGLEPAEVRENMQAAYEKAVQQAVDEGVITAEQAEQFQNDGFRMDRFGGRRGHGEFHRGFGGRAVPGSPVAPPAESGDEL